MLTQSQTMPLAIPQARTRSPKSKEDVLNALQVLVPEAQITRAKPHVASVYFPDTGATFLLTVHKPRGPKAMKNGNGERQPRRKTRKRGRSH